MAVRFEVERLNILQKFIAQEAGRIGWTREYLAQIEIRNAHFPEQRIKSVHVGRTAEARPLRHVLRVERILVRRGGKEEVSAAVFRVLL